MENVKLDQLVNSLIDFAKDYDPYEFMDTEDPEIDLFGLIKSDLENGKTYPYMFFLEIIINEENAPEALEALELLKSLKKYER